ncbi:MAG: hypothetical protein ACR2RA_03975 [Geminicoccaceae bacterium]
MTRRRPGTVPASSDQPRRPVARPSSEPRHSSEQSPIGIWYAAMIGAVLLIATAIYAAFLHQQVKEWRQAAEQLTIGQDLLRADRDEILQKSREREAALSTLEAAREQDRARLDGLDKQRRRLQADVLRLTQQLARNERQANGAAAGPPVDVDRLQREGDRLERELEALSAEVWRLESAVAEKDQALAGQAELLEASETKVETAVAARADLDARKIALEQDLEQLRLEIAERREGDRRRQIVRGHRASLGDVKPYIAEVGPEAWSVIEGWLALQLRRPMAVPDLAGHGWSYEGARLLGSSEGPPMAMLLYADADDRPASLTIVRDKRGERPLQTGENGGLRILDWREERHAFVLAGEAGEEALEAVALDLQNEPPRLSEDAAVPVSRYVRPSFRPDAEPKP